jgi:putative DNA modification/repair radical SAM protein
MEFYKRNYIEGLFLSSGIIRNADYTMEQVVAVARSLRLEHNFKGYIHLKTIPEADPDLLAQAGLYADRLSINVELPSAKSLQLLAPEKSASSIDRSMANLKEGISAYKESKREVKQKKAQHALPQFSPSGQSTQMIVGADRSDDAQILSKSSNLYQRFKLKRVYYSAFSPIPDASSELPLSPAPLMREHRLYQADWLLRFYGFTIDELAYSDVERTQPSQTAPEQMLALDKDPKLAWALRHLENFPVNLNTADYEAILRVPGIGVTTAKRLVSQRRVRAIRFQDLKKLRLAIDKVALFVQVLDHRPSHHQLESTQLERRFSQALQTQLDLFSV